MQIIYTISPNLNTYSKPFEGFFRSTYFFQSALQQMFLTFNGIISRDTLYQLLTILVIHIHKTYNPISFLFSL